MSENATSSTALPGLDREAFERDGWQLVEAPALLESAERAASSLPAWPSGPAADAVYAVEFARTGDVELWGSALSRRAFMMGMGPRTPEDPAQSLWGRRARRATEPPPAAADLLARLLPGEPASASAVCAYPGFPGGEEGRWRTSPAAAAGSPSLLAVLFLDDAADEWLIVPGSHRNREALLKLSGGAETLYEEQLDPPARPEAVRPRRGRLLLMDGALLRREPRNSSQAPRRELWLSAGRDPGKAAVAEPAGPSLLRRIIQRVKLGLYHPLSRRLRAPLKMVNVGAGRGWSHPACMALDQDPEVEVSHNLSTTGRLPFSDESLDAVYSSHCVEHLPAADVRAFVADCRRVLRPGGVLRLTCPDMDVVFDAYERRDLSVFDWRQGFYAWDGWLRMACRMGHTLTVDAHDDDALRRLYAQGGRTGLMERLAEDQARLPRQVLDTWPNGHKSWWTKPRLAAVMKEAGFSLVEEKGRNDSRWPAFRDRRFFDYSSPGISLYLEAVK